jgi:hypothetical protein
MANEADKPSMKAGGRPCPRCGALVKTAFGTCPVCGNAVGAPTVLPARRGGGFEWRSRGELFGLPLVHVAFGRDPVTKKIRVAKGIVAIGQFGVGLVTFAQVGVGLLFGFGQAVAGFVTVGQLALGLYFGAGQIATGQTAVGQIAIGVYALGQVALGAHVWTPSVKDPEAVRHFTHLWEAAKSLFGAGG